MPPRHGSAAVVVTSPGLWRGIEPPLLWSCGGWETGGGGLGGGFWAGSRGPMTPAFSISPLRGLQLHPRHP